MKKLLLFLFIFQQVCFGAIDATTSWEFRASNGSATNGGGFADLNPGTSVNYSIDDADESSADFSWTDLAQVQSSTTLTSATGGFTAAMVGNTIQITAGTNFDAGFYQITVYTDTNTVTIDRTAASAGNGSSGTGYVGGALDILTDAFLDNANYPVAGNIIYVKNSGTMTLTGNIDVAKDGTDLLMLKIYGYNSTRGDCPTISSGNQPVIAAAANTFSFDNYWEFKNLTLTITTAGGFDVDDYSRIINCFSTNSSGTANRYGLNMSTIESQVIGGEAVSTNGIALQSGNSYNRAYGIFLHDSNEGVNIDGNTGFVLVNSVIDTCSSIGIDTNNKTSIILLNNTIYSCGIGINGSTSKRVIALNNIITGCTTGAVWTTWQDTNYFDYNIWNNTTEVTNAVQGDHAINQDPLLTDPANNDFTLQASSPALSAGLAVDTSSNVVGDYKLNIGADQDDNSGTGTGTGTVSYGYIK